MSLIRNPGAFHANTHFKKPHNAHDTLSRINHALMTSPIWQWRSYYDPLCLAQNATNAVKRGIKRMCVR